MCIPALVQNANFTNDGRGKIWVGAWSEGAAGLLSEFSVLYLS